MNYMVKVDETLCDVNVYRTYGYCEEECNCESFVGSFSFELVDGNAVVHSWSFRDYDWNAARVAVMNFLLKWASQNNLTKVYVERSEADEFWVSLGWSVTGKCDMLEKEVNDCV